MLKPINEELKIRRQEFEDLKTYLMLKKIYFLVVGTMIGFLLALLVFFA